MKKSRRFKAEIIALVCVAILWAVNLKTDCVPRATVGALRQVVEAAPNNRLAHELLGFTYYGLGRTDKGDKAYDQAELLEYEQAVEANPTDANAHYQLGDAYYQIGNLNAAIQAYDEVLNLDSDYGDAYEQLAGCYWELDQPEKSIETWKRAITSDPEWAWPHMRLAFDYNDVGRYDDAIKEWKGVISLEPDVPGFHILLGDAYANANRRDDAISTYRQAVSLGPENKQAHFRLGKTYLETGDTDSASEEYRKLKVLDEELANHLRELLETHEHASTSADATPLDQIDLLAILSAQYELIMEMRLAPFDDIEAKVKTTIQHQLDTSRKQYVVEFDAIANDPAMPVRQKDQWLRQLNAQYQKQWISMEATLTPEVEAQEARRREIMAELETDYADRVARLQEIQTMIEKDVLDPVAAKREQLRIVGFDLPLSSLNAERVSSLTIGGSPPEEGTARDQTPTVDAIGIAADGRYYGMVDGRFIYEGNVVNGYQVQKIHPDSVEFEKDGEVWVRKVN